MKQVYKLFASAAVVLVGVTNLSARNWTPGTTTVTTIEAGKTYALKGIEAQSGNPRYLQGGAFVEKNFVTPDGVFEFVSAGDQFKDAEGNQAYYLVVHGKTTDQYVAIPGSNNFYTSSINRAWKVVVKEAKYADKNQEYQWNTQTAAGEDTVITLRGKEGLVRQSMEESEDKKTNSFDLSTLTYKERTDGVVIVSYQSKSPNKVEKDAEFNFLLTNEQGSLSTGKGTNYDRNAWNIVEVAENSAKEGLENMLAETFGENFDIDNLVDAKNNKDAYVLGENIGQYSKAKYDALKALYDQAQKVKNNEVTLSDAEIDKLTDELPKAFAEFKQSGKPLTEGYYIVQSYRGVKEAGYDGGAIYDEGAVSTTGKRLLWTYKGGNVTYKADEPLDYKSLKYIWKVEKDDSHPGFFFFKNMHTNRYIGNTNAKRQNENPLMTDQPEVSYNISANRNQAGFYSFYSDQLWKGAGNYWGYNGGDRWEYGGLHAGSDHNGVVVWDWQAAGSAFYARTITKAQVDSILNIAQQSLDNEKARDLVNKAQQALDKGYAYMAVDASGNRLEHANSGDFGKENDPGLVTDAEKLKAPMADTDEGKDIGVLLDGDANTFFHSSWHGGDGAWKGGHFLQFQLDAAQKELFLKWVKRVQGNNVNNNGAPAQVTLWGAKDDAALEKNKDTKKNAKGEEETDDSGNPIVDFDAWKKNNGWDSLAVSTFTYPYEITVGDSKKANGAGYAYFNIPDGYKNFRMEVVTRVNNGDKPNGNVYYNGSEFRVYQGKFDNVNSLVSAVPQADVDALKSAIAATSAQLKDQKTTKEQIAALQAAYDKFLQNYPEPTRVTEALAEAKKLANAAQEQEKVGYYKTGAKAKLNEVINSVETALNNQLKQHAPSVEQINNYLAQLNAGLTEFAQQLIMPEAGIYRLQSTSAEKTRSNRIITAVNSSREANLKMRGVVVENNEYKPEPGFENVLGSYWDVQKNDSGYVLKNLYTGLYAAPRVGTSAMTQSEKPYTFAVTFAKYPGSFNLVAKEADVADKKIFVNAEADNLVLWNTATGQDNSAFAFVPAKEELEKNIFGDDGSIKVYVDAEKMQIVTLPINAEFDAQSGKFYTVIGQDANNEIQLAEVKDKSLKAGQAYVFVPNKDNKTNLLTVYAPQDVTSADKLGQTTTPAEAVNGLVPVLENTPLRLNNGVFNNARDMVLLSENLDRAWANTGYFGLMPKTDKKGDLSIPAEAVITTLNKLVLTNGQAGAKAGVFTLSGVRVNNSNHLPAGVYIVNGKKQVVK